MSRMMANPYRALPSVDRLLSDGRVAALVPEYGAAAVTEAARAAIDEARRAIAGGAASPVFDALVAAVVERTRAAVAPTFRPVINATGIVLHTNLGRAPLSDEALAAMEAVSRGYSNLEFDLDSGERGSRTAHVEGPLCRLTGAGGALAVNNNAGAVLLGLAGLASGREVIISRGQLVEIGGGFRIPEIMAESGAVLVEVGTTNRTYLSDYENAVDSETAAVLHVHSSNFRIVGFAASPSLEELSRLTRKRHLLLLADLGSGSLLDTTQFGLGKEPTVQDSLAAGADLVFFSGDKLLGGPQAGLIVGRADLVATLRRHPLARALRLDKATLAALQATLIHYVKGDALRKVPVWRMIAMPLPEIEARARRWADAVGPPATVAEGRSMVGGGSLPEESLPTALLALPGDGLDIDAIAHRLRLGQPSVVARIERDRLLLDPRTVDPRDDEALIAAVKSAFR